jgi:hypothetical protein
MDSSDIDKLQTHLNRLGEWAVENEMKIGKQEMQQLIIAFLGRFPIYCLPSCLNLISEIC